MSKEGIYMKDEIIKILEGIRPDVDFNADQQLIDGNILDSFDVVSLATELMDEYGISITVEHLIPENFNTPEAIAALVNALLDE